MATNTFGFDDGDAGIGTRVQKFKGEKGRSYRFGFVWWPNIVEKKDFGAADLEPAEGKAPESLTPIFVKAQRHLVQGVGYVINQGPEYTQLLGTSPKEAIATIIVLWPTGKNGKISKEQLVSTLPEVSTWVFGGEKYAKLKKMHMSGYLMHACDVQADCEDAQYQKFNFLPANQCIFKELLKASGKNPEATAVTSHIIETVRALVPNLEREIGQKLTLDQLREKLGQEIQTPAGRPSASSASSDKDVDDLLGSMLDE